MLENKNEFKNLYEILSKLNWNKKNLDKHTIKHPIGDCYNNFDLRSSVNYRLLWGNLLNIHNIPRNKNGSNYKEVKEAYRDASLKVLSNLNNSIVYFHNGINEKTGKPYRSVGIFEDKEYKNSDKVLTTFVRGNFDNNKEDYYITTCYFKNRGFKEKLYYAYSLLKEPELFKINMDTNNFFEKTGIPKDFSLDKLNKLLDDSVVDDDRIGEIFNYCVINKKIDTCRYRDLVNFYNYNYCINDKKEKDNEIKITDELIGYIDELMKELDINDDLKISNCEIFIREKYNELIDKCIDKFLEKYASDETLDELINNGIDFSNLEEKLEKLYDNINITEFISDDLEKNKIKKFVERYLSTYILYFMMLIWNKNEEWLDNNLKICSTFENLIKFYVENINFNIIVTYPCLYVLRQYLDNKKYELETEMDNIFEDEENVFYLSLYKQLAKYNDNYSDEDFKYSFRYDEELEKILKINIDKN